MAKTKAVEEESSHEEEQYVTLNYIMNVTTLNITVESGAQLVMQSGSATPPNFPPK